MITLQIFLLLLVINWLFLGILAIILGYVYFPKNAKEKLPFNWELIIVILFGLISLIWMIEDIENIKKENTIIK